MNPDSDQLQPVTALPEVPQIEPAEILPVSDATQVPESTPSNEPLPLSPITDTPLADPAVNPQPTSFTMAPPAPTPAPVGVFTDIKPASPIAPQPIPPQPSMTGLSNTIPPNPTPSVATPQPFPVQPPVAAKKRINVGLLIGIIAGSLALIGGIIAILFLVVFANNGKVSESDLISGKTAETSYLYPKQWKEVTAGKGSGYGDKLGKDGKSQAIILIQKMSYIKPGITATTDKQISSLRQLLSSSITSSAAEKTLKESSDCSEVNNTTVNESTLKKSKSVGLLKITGTCKKDDVNLKMLLYILLGEDGYMRSAVIVSTEESWKQNEKVFNKMIDSVDQS